MRTGAIIAAAGKRNHDLRPILALHGTTFIRRIVMTLQKAAVEPIVIVADGNAASIRKHLSQLPVLVVENEGLEESQLLDTARLGWEHLEGKCDRLLFTLSDVPLVAVATIQKMMAAQAPLVIPVFEGEEGHPLLADASVFRGLLAWQGKGGLREAIRNAGVDAFRMEVGDEGILASTSTPTQYLRAVELTLKMQNYDRWGFGMDVRLSANQVVFDARAASSFRQMDRTGSMETLHTLLGMPEEEVPSYIEQLEKALGEKLIEAGGGRCRLTPPARDFIARYENFSLQAQNAVKELFDRNYRK